MRRISPPAGRRGRWRSIWPGRPAPPWPTLPARCSWNRGTGPRSRCWRRFLRTAATRRGRWPPIAKAWASTRISPTRRTAPHGCRCGPGRTSDVAGRVTAVLGPTNTGKTHYAIERMLAHRTGVIGLPLRLLAREVYDRIVKARGPSVVALITGEERIVPERAAYWVATTEAMPEVLAVFVAM